MTLMGSSAMSDLKFGALGLGWGCLCFSVKLTVDGKTSWKTCIVAASRSLRSLRSHPTQTLNAPNLSAIPMFVIPAKAGIQRLLNSKALDSSFRWNDVDGVLGDERP